MINNKRDNKYKEKYEIESIDMETMIKQMKEKECKKLSKALYKEAKKEGFGYKININGKSAYFLDKGKIDFNDSGSFTVAMLTLFEVGIEKFGEGVVLKALDIIKGTYFD